MLKTRLARSFVLSLLIAACIGVFAAALVAADRLREEPRAQDTTELSKISETWAREWGAKNLDSVVALYAEDAVFLPSTGSRITGRSAIRELFSGAFATHSSELHVRSKRTEQSGQLAYDSGEYEETSIAGGVKHSGRGNYLVVLRREGKNQWRIVQHMWTDLSTPEQPK